MTNAGRSHEAQTFTYIPESGTATISNAEATKFKYFCTHGDILFGIGDLFR